MAPANAPLSQILAVGVVLMVDSFLAFRFLPIAAFVLVFAPRILASDGFLAFQVFAIAATVVALGPLTELEE